MSSIYQAERGRVVQSINQATNVNAGSVNKKIRVSEHKVHSGLLFMWLQKSEGVS